MGVFFVQNIAFLSKLLNILSQMLCFYIFLFVLASSSLLILFPQKLRLFFAVLTARQCITYYK